MDTRARSEVQYHFTDLDGVRGVLAVTVMCFHFGLNSILDKITGISDANWGGCVDFFFVLSGFVICKSISRKAVSLRYFVLKRFWRLFPLHLIILALFSAVLFSEQISFGSLTLTLTAIAPLVQQPIANFPAWSMGYEFYIPILFVALIGKCRISLPVVYVCAGLFFVSSAIASQQLLSNDDRLLGGYLDSVRAVSGLGLGFAAWKLFEATGGGTFSRKNNVIFLLIVSMFFVLVIASAEVSGLGVLLPLLNVSAMFVGASAKTLFSSRPLQWLGRLSFGIYMVHVPILYCFVAVFGSSSLDGNIVLKLAMIVTSFVLAQILYLLVERPGIYIGANFSSWFLRLRWNSPF